MRLLMVMVFRQQTVCPLAPKPIVILALAQRGQMQKLVLAVSHQAAVKAAIPLHVKPPMMNLPRRLQTDRRVIMSHAGR